MAAPAPCWTPWFKRDREGSEACGTCALFCAGFATLRPCPANTLGHRNPPMPIVNRVADLHNEIKEWRPGFPTPPEQGVTLHPPPGSGSPKLNRLRRP